MTRTLEAPQPDLGAIKRQQQTWALLAVEAADERDMETRLADDP